MQATPPQRVIETVFLTSLALTAFAANSVLCRLALRSGAIDAAGFTVIRLGSGVLALLLILFLFEGRIRSAHRGHWSSASMLWLYAVTFSFAYISLAIGTGALILFGAVQLTMIIGAVRSGERLHRPEWTGAATAFAGLVYLVSPGLTAPPLGASILMASAGIAWGYYSLWGRTTADPLADTAYNFVRTLPFLILLAPFLTHLRAASFNGVLLATASGAVASGSGYAIWYRALRGLTSTRAAVVQLLVPVLAALAGILFFGEHLSLRVLVASILILGGVGLAVAGRAGLIQLRTPWRA